ncbi:hypothetical protein E2C01_067302 [Portunus trituberculatus]|uniref:Uncharacterized protein n=1 Tax=Portunus trituberculatus TaxID=210409 RepID=A0A5B7HTE4_PORTR|nr:hypothetical protein [Portunus trituberculatus]
MQVVAPAYDGWVLGEAGEVGNRGRGELWAVVWRNQGKGEGVGESVTKGVSREGREEQQALSSSSTIVYIGMPQRTNSPVTGTHVEYNYG